MLTLELEQAVELTTREIEVLLCIAKGLDSSATADQLSISVATVRTHVSNIFKKTDTHTRAEAVIYGIQHHLIDPFA